MRFLNNVVVILVWQLLQMCRLTLTMISNPILILLRYKWFLKQEDDIIWDVTVQYEEQMIAVTKFVARYWK